MSETSTEQLKRNCKNIAMDFETYGADYLSANEEDLYDQAETLRDEAMDIEGEDPEEASGLRSDADALEQKAEVCGSDNYGVEYRISQDGDLRSVEIMVACGGPNIYIEIKPHHAYVRGYWGGDEEEVYVNVSDSALGELLDHYEEDLRCIDLNKRPY